MQNTVCAAPPLELPAGPTPGISGSAFLPRRRAALLAVAEKRRREQATSSARLFASVALVRSTREDLQASWQKREQRRLATRDRHIAQIRALATSHSAEDNVLNVS